MIELNKVGIEIDGKIYKFYKINFGFQRKLIELQSNLNKYINSLAKKYDISSIGIEKNENLTNDEKLQIATYSLEMQNAVSCLFVNKDEAKILDNFDMDNVTKLIESLQ